MTLYILPKALQSENYSQVTHYKHPNVMLTTKKKLSDVFCLCFAPNRSSLSEGSNNKTANNRIRITLSARAGSQNQFHKFLAPFNYPIPSLSQSTPPSIHTETYTQSLPPTYETTTTPTSTSTSTSPPIKLLVNKPLPDHYYFSDQDDSSEYYDNVDEISIPSIKPPLHNKKNHSPSKSSIRTSSSTLSQSTAPALIYVRPNNALQENHVQFRLSEYKDTRYDQSTLKSFFMNSPSTEALKLTTTSERPTSTQKITTTTDGRRDFEAQRQKILSFIISENQPSSFKAPSTTTPKSLVLATNNQEINSNNANYFRAFVNTQESTTLSHPNTTSTNSPRAQNVPTKTTLLLSRDQLAPSKPIRLTLSASLGAASNVDASSPSSYPGTQKQFTQGNVEEIPLIKTRQQETRQSLHLKPIEPTTYSPQKPFVRVTTESTTTTTTELPTSILLEDDPSEMDPFVVHSRRRPYVNDFLTNANIPTRFPPRSTTTTETPVDVNEFTTQAPSTTTTFRSIIQTFTSRGLVFKENLNRTFEPQNLKPIVSPYISLETQRLTNAIRTTSPHSVDFSSSKLTSTTAPVTPSTYRSYFLITAPVTVSSASKVSSPNVKGPQPSEVRAPIPSTFLFPETSSVLPTTASPPPSIRPSPFVVNTESNLISSTENSRGRYRPFVTFTSQNSIDEEPTTYAPRVRFNTRTQTMDESVSSSSPPPDQPAARRKIVRLKSALAPPNKPSDDFFSSTDHNRIDATTASTPLREVSPRLVASPSRETSKYAPKDVVGKLSYSSDIPNRNSFSQLPKEETSATVDITDKPFFYIRFKNASTNLEPIETSTKKFRATVEMPEMNVPTEKEMIAFVQQVHEELYDDEASNHRDSLPDVVGGEHEVDDYAFVDSAPVTASTTAAPKYVKTQFNTTYSTVYATSTSTPLTTTSLRTTEHVPTTTTTASPKSLIPPRTSRVNSAIKTSIVAGLPRRNSASSIKCNDISANAKCNEIPSRYRTKKQNHSI